MTNIGKLGFKLITNDEYIEKPGLEISTLNSMLSQMLHEDGRDGYLCPYLTKAYVELNLANISPIYAFAILNFIYRSISNPVGANLGMIIQFVKWLPDDELEALIDAYRWRPKAILKLRELSQKMDAYALIKSELGKVEIGTVTACGVSQLDKMNEAIETELSNKSPYGDTEKLKTEAKSLIESIVHNYNYIFGSIDRYSDSTKYLITAD